MIDDIATVLKGLKSCIEIILCELQSIQSILEITNEQFPMYERILYSLQHSINNLTKIYNYKIPIQHILKFELLNIIHTKLKDFSTILANFRYWNTRIVKPKCFSFEQIMFLINNPKPSRILSQLEKAFTAIEPLIKDQMMLEEKILGNAIRIEHPILQKAWLMVGGNQLNETAIPINIIVENLYAMYLIENNNYSSQKEYIIKKITEFLNKIDGIASAKADGQISIIEMNFIKPNENNSRTVKSMIGITDKDLFEELFSFSKELMEEIEKEDKLEPMNIKIPIEFKDPVHIDHYGSRTIREPLCVGYGADFNNVNACEFKVLSELLPSDKYTLCGIDVECVASDQGYGGTNQSHLHYQVNDNTTVGAFRVDRNQFPDNIYHFSIPPESILLDDTVKLWIFAPQWSGWSMTLHGVKATARFVPSSQNDGK